MKKLLFFSLFTLNLAHAFEFRACHELSPTSQALTEVISSNSLMTSRRIAYCERKLREFEPTPISNFYASDLKQAFNCHLAFELEENLLDLKSLSRCFEESNKNNQVCKRIRTSLDRETTQAFNSALSALYRTKPYTDRDRSGSSAFRLRSEHYSEIGMIVTTRTPQERVSSILDERVSVKAGLGSLDFEGLNLDTFLQSLGFDISLVGGYQSIPRLPAPFVSQERNEFVSFVSDILVACDDPWKSEIEASSMATLTPSFMGRAARCEKDLVQPLLQLRQSQALSRYFEIVASNPHIAYLDVRSLPLRLNSRDEAGSRKLMRDAFSQVERNILKLQRILLTNSVDYSTESALLPAMNQFIADGNQHFCPQARQILRLRPLASIGVKAKRFFVNQLAYASCFGAGSFLGSPSGASVVCPLVIEGAKTALEAQRSLRLSQSLTIFTEDDRLIEGIINSEVLRSSDARFVDAAGRLMNVPKDILLKKITGPLEDLLAAELVKKGYFPVLRGANGREDPEAAQKKAKRFIRGLRRIAEI